MPSVNSVLLVHMNNIESPEKEVLITHNSISRKTIFG